MYEIERKFRLSADQWESLRDSLHDQFGEPHEQNQSDKIYLEVGKTFDTHVKGESMMRIRDQNGTTIFTYKRTVIETGNRIEHETVVTNPKAIEAMLDELGWNLAVHIEKRRLEFSSEAYTYALDNVKDLGTFLEIEYVSPVDDPNAESTIFTEATRLGLEPEMQIERKNYGFLVWRAMNR